MLQLKLLLIEQIAKRKDKNLTATQEVLEKDNQMQNLSNLNFPAEIGNKMR